MIQRCPFTNCQIIYHRVCEALYVEAKILLKLASCIFLLDS